MQTHDKCIMPVQMHVRIKMHSVKPRHDASHAYPTFQPLTLQPSNAVDTPSFNRYPQSPPPFTTRLRPNKKVGEPEWVRRPLKHRGFSNEAPAENSIAKPYSIVCTAMNSGANVRETMVMRLMRMFMDGPEVSLNGSPTVSPTTAAL